MSFKVTPLYLTPEIFLKEKKKNGKKEKEKAPGEGGEAGGKEATQ